MKLVVWRDECLPDIVGTDDGVVLIEDHHTWHNLQPGDMIQHRHSSFGTQVYIVEEVIEPTEGLYPRGIRIAALRGVFP